MTFVIAASRPGYGSVAKHLAKRIRARFVLISRPQDLTTSRLSGLGPRMIFFPHWSYFIPKRVFERYECVTFHMTDLPYGRGGSPLQNLIVRGFRKTKISAIRTVEKMDAGPVYIKRSLSLRGTAEEILARAARIIEEMIISLIRKHPSPHPQKGKVVHFTRRRPEDGDIVKLRSIQQLYDYIRMLDGVGYPRAFVNVGAFRMEFQKASQKPGRVMANVLITKQK